MDRPALVWPPFFPSLLDCHHPAGRLIAVLVLAHLPFPAGAATIHVPSEYPTIQAGIDAASPGDIVLVACGTYYEHAIRMDAGIELRSETGEADCVTIDVSGYPVGIWCLSLSQPTRIMGLTITGASGDGLALQYSQVTVENCRFWRNVETNPAYSGGAGVVCGYSYMAPSFINCRFEENFSLGRGAGLLSRESDPDLTDCVFERNFAVQGGGGASLEYGVPTLTRCSFVADSTSAWGGGVFFALSTPTLRDCDFQACWADTGGAGLHCRSSGLVHIERCAFTGNSAAQGGGADFALSTITMIDCSFTGNTSVSGAGGGMNANNTAGMVQGCLFDGNTAGGAGGGFHVGSSPLDVVDSIFEDNSAFRGGGLSFGDSGGLVEGCTFRRNHTSANGGGMNTSFRDPTIRDCLFEENSADGSGGGLSCYRSWPEVSGSIFANNTCDEDGGGISCYVRSNPTITACTFYGNAAINGGGGVASTSESSMTLQNCIIAYGTTGDAAHCDATSSVTFSCSDLYGNIGGDWVGCAAGQEGVRGNFFAPPLFCDPAAGNYHLAENSPCANAPGCGLVGALPIGCPPLVAVGDPPVDLTRSHILGPSVPNPFRDSAEIRYVLTAASDPALVRFDIYGADGRLVRRLVNEPRQPGVHAVRWDGKDDRGQRLPSGIYFSRLRVGGDVETMRIVLLE